MSSSAKNMHPEWTSTDPVVLLDDQDVIDFIADGFIKLDLPLPESVHQEVINQLLAHDEATIVDLQNDPTSLRFVEAIPALRQVIGHPVVRGAIISLVGEAPFIFGRYVHTLKPGGGGRYWHQDDVNVRHYQQRRLILGYYPAEVTPDMGPTFIIPGSHLRNCPTARMQTYGNIHGQKALTGPPGALYLMHYDLWHSASVNKHPSNTRYMIKYYFDRTSEPQRPSWQHNPETAVGLAMQALHQRRSVASGSQSEFYRERHLRWRMWSYLCGQPDGEVWPAWQRVHRTRRTEPITDVTDFQGYIGAPMY